MRQFLAILLLNIAALAAVPVQCSPVNNACAGGGATCTITFNNGGTSVAVRAHDTIFVAAWTLVGDSTITILSVANDAAFTIGPHAGEATTAGGVNIAGLQNATGGETTLVVTMSAAPAGTWLAAACEYPPSVLEAVANDCTGTDAAAATTHTTCSVTVQTTCHGVACNDTIFQCIRGISSNAKGLAGYQTVLAQSGSACAALNTTVGTGTIWTYSSNTKVAFVGWAATDTGGTTIR